MTSKKTDKARKTAPISVRLTADERTCLREMADAESLSVGEYIRMRLFGSRQICDRDTTFEFERISPEARQRLLAQILMKVGHSGVSERLKDISDAVKVGMVDLGPELHMTLRDTKLELQAFRHVLVKALGLRKVADSNEDRT